MPAVHAGDRFVHDPFHRGKNRAHVIVRSQLKLGVHFPETVWTIVEWVVGLEPLARGFIHQRHVQKTQTIVEKICDVNFGVGLEGDVVFAELPQKCCKEVLAKSLWIIQMVDYSAHEENLLGCQKSLK